MLVSWMLGESNQEHNVVLCSHIDILHDFGNKFCIPTPDCLFLITYDAFFDPITAFAIGKLSVAGEDIIGKCGGYMIPIFTCGRILTSLD